MLDDRAVVVRTSFRATDLLARRPRASRLEHLFTRWRWLRPHGVRDDAPRVDEETWRTSRPTARRAASSRWRREGLRWRCCRSDGRRHPAVIQPSSSVFSASRHPPCSRPAAARPSPRVLGVCRPAAGARAARRYARRGPSMTSPFVGRRDGARAARWGLWAEAHDAPIDHTTRSCCGVQHAALCSTPRCAARRGAQQAAVQRCGVMQHGAVCSRQQCSGAA